MCSSSPGAASRNSWTRTGTGCRSGKGASNAARWVEAVASARARRRGAWSAVMPSVLDRGAGRAYIRSARPVQTTVGSDSMSASQQLYALADRAKHVEEHLDAAKTKGEANLKTQVDKARQASQQHAADMRAAADRAEAKTS